MSVRIVDQIASIAWLSAELPGRELARILGRRIRRTVVVANAIGAAVVAGFALLVLPPGRGLDVPRVASIDLPIGLAYLVVASLGGVLWARRRLEQGADGLRSWLDPDRAPTPAQRHAALRTPVRIMLVQVVLWGLAAVLFAVINAFFSPLLSLEIGVTIAIGGLTTSTAAYLVAELLLRPLAARALAAGPTARDGVPGVAARWILAWALGTGGPVLGLVALGVVGLTAARASETSLALIAVALGAIALVFGALVTLLAAYSTVLPIDSIRRGLEAIGAGRLDASVVAWDTTEMGLLQSGFNEMAAGLRERVRIRDAFDRQVGREAAEHALSAAASEMGGELTAVAVLFVDVIGSTRLAAAADPREVVGLLNELFGQVVAVVDAHGGWINKFEGDAALAIFGAPTPLADKEAAALAAARELIEVSDRGAQRLQIAIGVASGEVVAGNVGAASRFEYTVIGDPVNAAARITDLAKQRPERVLAALDTVERSGSEARNWTAAQSVVLRGRSTPTALAVPRRSVS